MCCLYSKLAPFLWKEYSRHKVSFRCCVKIKFTRYRWQKSRQHTCELCTWMHIHTRTRTYKYAYTHIIKRAFKLAAVTTLNPHPHMNVLQAYIHPHIGRAATRRTKAAARHPSEWVQIQAKNWGSLVPLINSPNLGAPNFFLHSLVPTLVTRGRLRRRAPNNQLYSWPTFIHQPTYM